MIDDKILENPEVSIVLSLYNGEKYIKQTLESVFNQTYQNFEIIIVDDESTDNSPKIIEEIDDPRIRYHRKKNGGVASSRNKGVELARGKFIAHLDQDDLWHPDKLRLQVDAINKSPDIGLVFCWINYIDADGNYTGKTEYNINSNFYANLLLVNFVNNGSVPLIRKECFDKIGKYIENSISDDWDMWIRIAKKYEFACINDYMVMYRTHGSSMSKNRYKKMMQDMFDILNREFKETNDTEIKKLEKRAYSYAYRYIADVCRHTPDKNNCYEYILKSIQLYPPILLEKHMKATLVRIFIPKHLFNFLKSFSKKKRICKRKTTYLGKKHHEKT